MTQKFEDQETIARVMDFFLKTPEVGLYEIRQKSRPFIYQNVKPTSVSEEGGVKVYILSAHWPHYGSVSGTIKASDIAYVSVYENDIPALRPTFAAMNATPAARPWSAVKVRSATAAL